MKPKTNRHTAIYVRVDSGHDNTQIDSLMSCEILHKRSASEEDDKRYSSIYFKKLKYHPFPQPPIQARTTYVLVKPQCQATFHASFDSPIPPFVIVGWCLPSLPCAVNLPLSQFNHPPPLARLLSSRPLPCSGSLCRRAGRQGRRRRRQQQRRRRQGEREGQEEEGQ